MFHHVRRRWRPSLAVAVLLSRPPPRNGHRLLLPYRPHDPLQRDVPQPPQIADGHEFTGTSIALGSAVSNSDFKPDDRIVALGWFDTCSLCAMCMGPEEDTHYCKTLSSFRLEGE
jgi:threonine dehydrogenase-like Zn-dependent dehydrogenase